jgi:hypothetical protein
MAACALLRAAGRSTPTSSTVRIVSVCGLCRSFRRAVDQPAGTGYSYTSTDKYVHELTDAAGQLLQFLDRFYAVFPELRTADTYLAGEVRAPPAPCACGD